MHDNVTDFIQYGDPMWPDLIAATKPRIIVEVGTFKGRTAIFMAHLIKQLKLDAKIICIDTWVGSPEHWATDDPFGKSRRWLVIPLFTTLSPPMLSRLECRM